MTAAAFGLKVTMTVLPSTVCAGSATVWLVAPAVLDVLVPRTTSAGGALTTNSPIGPAPIGPPPNIGSAFIGSPVDRGKLGD
jgi:hypothetical protein